MEETLLPGTLAAACPARTGKRSAAAVLSHNLYESDPPPPSIPFPDAANASTSYLEPRHMPKGRRIPLAAIFALQLVVVAT